MVLPSILRREWPGADPRAYTPKSIGPLAQTGRALASHARGHWFKSSTVHDKRPLTRGNRSNIPQVMPDTLGRFALRRLGRL